jgi:hypothetical protein
MKKEKTQNRNEDSGFIYTYYKVESTERDSNLDLHVTVGMADRRNTHALPPPGRDHFTSLKTYEAVELTGIKGRTRDRDGTVHAEGKKG